MLSCQHPALASTHFIATDCSIVMMDERYPGYPVCVAFITAQMNIILVVVVVVVNSTCVQKLINSQLNLTRCIRMKIKVLKSKRLKLEQKE